MSDHDAHLDIHVDTHLADHRDDHVADPSAGTAGAGRRRRLVVVGHGMVGQRLVEAIRERDREGRWAVTVLGEEPRPAYDRVALTSYLTGTTADELSLVPDEHDGEGDDDCVVRTGDPVVAIDRSARCVTTASGVVVEYDALVLATGSAPFVPPIPGADLDGCFVYRTIDDLDAIRDRAATARTGAVVGGGLLGLEAANALRSLGLDTHVVEFAPRLMPAQVDAGGGEMLRRRIEQLGLTVHADTATERIEASGSDPHDPSGPGLRMVFSDGAAIEVGMVVFSAGIRARDELARACDLDVGERGGVVVDESCRTSDPHIWAIGECARVDGTIYGLVAPGYDMAEVVADQLLGGAAVFSGADTSTKLKLLGVDVASFGDAHATTPGSLEVVYADPVAGVYKKLVVTDDASTMLGGLLVGDASSFAALRTMVGEPLPDTPEQVLMVGPAPSGLDDAAQVCSCQNVSAGTIRSAIGDDGCCDVASVKACTKAGTVCGSCVPLIKTLLAQSGVETSKALCEHFDLSRAELFDVIRVTGQRTFTEIISSHGQGRGCDICKPAVASILASLGSGHILDGEQAALQDTNDHFLANLQRNGTYSVVPRVPGGELTPEKLIVIGEVARDFGLYMKITGGQRIDMFGARVEQLPAIWRRLVDAGFESGHAYGKALRTVKSCVGSTWCRYGVQDSTSLAIMLELRYRGLRSPHKIKAGVSGCARECAEARSKDFGIIASEQGWNLYVGGNGGFNPRHAQLFASNLDTDELVRLIDRFLMFYIRTADRLQRTSAWLEGLDDEHGDGLAYLHRVIVDDDLGICADLDAAVATHVASYTDEWAAVLEDEEKLSRFVSFVNAPDVPDPSIQFVTERDQIRPAGGTESGSLPEGVLGGVADGVPDGVAGGPGPVPVSGPTLEVVRR
ncbi:nitrite reductase large subunit [Actinobacteria bacterium YIM 96077]|uniref:assimilatory sulfite reductase (ferredoxin) n=1 Tax=Phytoactinopolyspora halophila TaxID=1981511 RepID=A0A329R640_9ACTN|nr:nitrite reductase large subunit NirB [Phytoactinopolyspora halophila]AYY11864.1 nitrite reductase large subunit [Actinobacteria bacterium YIM 96077]RAW18902.1 nitrite reductase (NAD(P)H) [Phytoactinopolyspora halophila]